MLKRKYGGSMNAVLEYKDKSIPINTPIVIEKIVKKNIGISILLEIGQIPIDTFSEFSIEKNTTNKKKIKNTNFEKNFFNITCA